jgi:hypothetical protein
MSLPTEAEHAIATARAVLQGQLLPKAASFKDRGNGYREALRTREKIRLEGLTDPFDNAPAFWQRECCCISLLLHPHTVSLLAWNSGDVAYTLHFALRVRYFSAFAAASLGLSRGHSIDALRDAGQVEHLALLLGQLWHEGAHTRAFVLENVALDEAEYPGDLRSGGAVRGALLGIEGEGLARWFRRQTSPYSRPR